MRHIVGKHSELSSNNQNDSNTCWVRTGTVHGSGIRGVVAVPPQHPLCTNPASWRGQWVSSHRTLLLQGQTPPAVGYLIPSELQENVLLCVVEAVPPSAVHTRGRKSRGIALEHAAHQQSKQNIRTFTQMGWKLTGAMAWCFVLGKMYR